MTASSARLVISNRRVAAEAEWSTMFALGYSTFSIFWWVGDTALPGKCRAAARKN
jgi:hypothetical protein